MLATAEEQAEEEEAAEELLSCCITNSVCTQMAGKHVSQHGGHDAVIQSANQNQAGGRSSR